jgi:UDP-2,3-diacylglucosamine hydrolase
VSKLEAPDHWQCMEFISDLHLHEGLPQTTLAFEAYLANTQADAVFILGDLFEAWVGDDMRHQPYEARCTAALSQAGQRLWLGFMAGNRDFLLGADMLAACHAHRLDDPTVLSAFGCNYVLTHGDAWCLNDSAYLAFREKIRQPDWAQQFLTRPLEERLLVAKQMRTNSQAQQGGMGDLADVDPSISEKWLTDSQARDLIHGHTHRPATEVFTPAGHWRHVLSDWDMDGVHGAPHAQVLRLTSAGFERVAIQHSASSSMNQLSSLD